MDEAQANVARRLLMLGVGDRSQHLRLLVAALVIAQLGGVLFEGLAEAGDVAVAEDAPGAGEEAVLAAIAGDVLRGQVADEGLGHGEAGGGRWHAAVSFQMSGLRILYGALADSQLRMQLYKDV